jgi:hypothetical protein
LLNELFAYADPRLPTQPELLDSTVDIEESGQVARRFGWSVDQPFIFHIVQPRKEPWLFSPVLGIPQRGCVFRYPLTIVDMTIERAVDLRCSATMQWLFETFVAMEVANEGRFTTSSGEVIGCYKDPPPADPTEFVPTLLSQILGGGTTFIQGVGAWLRANGVEALIYPSARSDSRSVSCNGTIVESYGYILVDYRDSPPCAFEPRRYFGALPKWRERSTKPIAAQFSVDGDTVHFEVKGVLKLQQYRFAVFHDWTKTSLAHSRNQLQHGEKKLGERVQLSLQRPSAILGSNPETILGTDNEFRNEEGGPVTGFLIEWIAGPYNTVASFLSSVLPTLLGKGWHERWEWDGSSWFLHILCSQRPWALLKCPACLCELFWNIPAGRPVTACPGCGFNNGGVDVENALAAYANYAAKFAARHTAPEDWKAFDAESIQLYSSVCWRHEDAVTGVKLPVQPKTFRVMEQLASGYRPGNDWFFQRRDHNALDPNNLDICCPNCAWAGIASMVDKVNLPPACPACGYGTAPPMVSKSERPMTSEHATTPSQMPDEFVNSIAGTILSAMNNPHVRDDIDAIDPGASDAAEKYGKIFGWAIPSAPLLSGGDVKVIAKKIKQIVMIEGQPISVPEAEVFAFLSSFFRPK